MEKESIIYYYDENENLIVERKTKKKVLKKTFQVMFDYFGIILFYIVIVLGIMFLGH